MTSTQYAAAIQKKLIEPKNMLEPIQGLPEMFERCFLNTLETTLQQDPDGKAFIITGDIDAMWLRDSTQQVLHYLRFAKENDELRALFLQIIEQQAALVLLDPYANAFNREANGKHGAQDIPCPHPKVWERKYELDSLCHVLFLACRYVQATGQSEFQNKTFLKAVRKILEIIRTEQDHANKSEYFFVRTGRRASSTLPFGGRGNPVGETGMSWSGFRPSDDACQYGYLIPANLFAANVLQRTASVIREVEPQLANSALRLSQEIQAGIERFGMVRDAQYGLVYAYETDGLGHHLMMDDANVPSLLSLPYLGICEPEEEVYANTRNMILSSRNPYYFSGKAGSGIGSPHTPDGYIWPISLCIQGMTSTQSEEIVRIMATVLTTHAGTLRMHESFDKDAPDRFTRSWFAWANSMFGEWIYRLYEAGSLKGVVERVKQLGVETLMPE